MGCKVSAPVAEPPRKRSTVTLTTSEKDLGVKLSPHLLGDLVEEVPAGSQGAAIGLQVGDVINKAGTVGKTQFPVKYYQGLQRVVLILNNNDGVTAETPMSLVIFRDEEDEKKPNRNRADSKTSTAVATDTEASSRSSKGTV